MVSIDVQVLNEDDTKVSATLNIEMGMQYIVKVKGIKSGSTASSPVTKCFTVIFSSPNYLNSQEIGVNSYSVSSGFGECYYCPNSLSLEAISIVE